MSANSASVENEGGLVHVLEIVSIITLIVEMKIHLPPTVLDNLI